MFSSFCSLSCLPVFVQFMFCYVFVLVVAISVYHCCVDVSITVNLGLFADDVNKANMILL